MFRPDEVPMIRGALAATIKAVISQRLIPRSDGKGMVATMEILLGTPAVRDHIRDATEFSALRQLIREGRQTYGMQSFDDALVSLVTSGLVLKDDALNYASSKSDLELKLSGVGQ
jgi:twitching motility protein PilT